VVVVVLGRGEKKKIREEGATMGDIGGA
jgi:hypothetical protein